MLASIPVHFASPLSFAAGLALLALICAIIILRRPRLDRWALFVLILGCVLIAIASGEPLIDWPSSGTIAVMVDLSPSTRCALFRDRTALDARIHQLLGDHPYRLLAFAGANQTMPDDKQLPDIPTDQTRFIPPVTDAIVLFSDGQFDLPATAPPTYPVIDPALDFPADARVAQLDTTGNNIVATIQNTGDPRALHWTGATPLTPAASTGGFQQYARPATSGIITAQLSPGDRWPENDSLSIIPAPPPTAQRWWVGLSPPPGWLVLDPAAVSNNPTDYLNTSTIVLHNIPADALSSEQQQRLTQFIRDLGGSLVIAGGDRAFAAGGYDGTALDALSPLASSPPQPTTHWIILIDGSGSMATSDIPANASPWQIESTAVTALLPRLPPNDPVSVGSFAASLTWWTTGQAAHQAATLTLPPPTVYPTGPTNLAPALDQIIASTNGSTLTQLLVMTDADTALPNPTALAAHLMQKKIHLHLLAIGHGSALPALRTIAAATGGSVVEQFNPAEWITAAQVLLKQALPDRYQHQPLTVQFAHPALPPQHITAWNQAWLRADATAIAIADAHTLAATAQRGLGRVTAIAYPADPATILALADQIQSPPHDPRFTITCENSSPLKITVSAVANDHFLNSLPLKLELRDARQPADIVAALAIPQTDPGLYILHLPSAAAPRFATIANGSEVLDRFAITGRYAPEFDHIGNNLPALRDLAHRTGGQVIPPNRTAPIDFHWPTQPTPLAPALSLLAATTIAAALLRQRRVRPPV